MPVSRKSGGYIKHFEAGMKLVPVSGKGLGLTIVARVDKHTWLVCYKGCSPNMILKDCCESMSNNVIKTVYKQA